MGRIGFMRGFHEIHNTGMGGMESAEHVMPVVDKWMADNAAKDGWFLHLNFWDPHTPYRAPADVGEPFKDAPLPKWLDNDEVIRKHNALTGPHTSLDIAMYDDGGECEIPAAARQGDGSGVNAKVG